MEESHACGDAQAERFRGEADFAAQRQTRMKCRRRRRKEVVRRRKVTKKRGELWRRGYEIRIDCFLEGKGRWFD